MNDHKYLSTTNLKSAINEICDLRIKLSVQNRMVAAFASKLSSIELKDAFEKNGIDNFFPDPATDRNIDNMCFIRLYSFFESFKGNVLIDLYYMLPETIPKNKKIDVESILLWTNS